MAKANESDFKIVYFSVRAPGQNGYHMYGACPTSFARAVNRYIVMREGSDSSLTGDIVVGLKDEKTDKISKAIFSTKGEEIFLTIQE